MIRDELRKANELKQLEIEVQLVGLPAGMTRSELLKRLKEI